MIRIVPMQKGSGNSGNSGNAAINGYLKDPVDTLNDLQNLQNSDNLDLRYVKEDNKLYIFRTDVTIGDIKAIDNTGYWLAINDSNNSFIVSDTSRDLKAIFGGNLVKEILITVIEPYSSNAKISIGDNIGEASLVTHTQLDLTIQGETYGFNPMKIYNNDSTIKVKIFDTILNEPGLCLISIEFDKAYNKV